MPSKTDGLKYEKNIEATLQLPRLQLVFGFFIACRLLLIVSLSKGYCNSD